jgi:RND family efflux transporter MFP subunit
METSEEGLRRQVEDLTKQLDEEKRKTSHEKPRHPSHATLWLIGCLTLVAIGGAFVFGYLPRQKREGIIVAEAKEQQSALPIVNVTPVVRSLDNAGLVLPGSLAAVTEAPILARSEGYIKRRYVDIGDHVKTGQLLAEIEAPEVDHQVAQAAAAVRQAQAAIEQANANYQQGKANEGLAKLTADRWQRLAAKGAVSVQENDQYQAQYQAQVANLNALEKAVSESKSSLGSAEANLSRLKEMQGYEKVIAPFAGIITARYVDTGALISANTTLLYRLAQADRLRVYVNVPQSNVEAVHTGQSAQLTIAELPGRIFIGTVTRTANSLDPATRTLLTEVQVPNPAGQLLPGMYSQVDLRTTKTAGSLLIPGDALVNRANGTLSAVVGPDNVIHFRKVTVGRDYGDRIEIQEGLAEGDLVVENPSDVVQEGAKVNAVRAAGGKPAK